MIFLITFFAIVNSSTGDYAASYDGMDQVTITRLERERGNTVQFVTKEAHDAFIKSKEIQPDLVREAIKREALLTVKRSTATTTQKLNALISLMDLDR